MRERFGIQEGVARIKTKTSRTLLIISAAVLGMASVVGFAPAFAGASSQSVIYNNTPSPVPGNVVSLGYEATQTKEFGSQVEFDGTARKDPEVTVVMSSWACKSGSWYAHNCITNPGSTFTHPVTINVYNANSDDTVGSLIKSKTQTFTMPYRPTADDGTNCNPSTPGGDATGEWSDGTNCYNGKAFKISFDLDGVTLPDNAIISVAYNTSHYGNSPVGEGAACYSTPQGCPYDSLNVGLNPTPSVGSSVPSDDVVYWNTLNGSSYTGGGVGNTFRMDTGWAGTIPAIKVEASPGKSNQHGNGHHGHHNNGHGHKNHSYRGFYSFDHN